MSIGNKNQAQVVINELQGMNLGNILDEDGQPSNWVELYNSDSFDVNLQGYFLSNKNDKQQRWPLPPIILQSGKHLLIFTSGKDRSYFIDHWETPVWYNDMWKYRVPAANMANWNQPNFNDALWANGKGGIGFGDGDDSTNVGTCTSLYLRKKFDVTDTAQVLKMLFALDYDDGYVAYLNGQEIARNGLGGNPPNWNDLASINHEAVIYTGGQPDTVSVLSNVFKGLLKPTGNLLAIEIHNNTGNSTDMSAIPFLSLAITDSGQWYPSHNLSWIPSSGKNYFHTNFTTKRNTTVYLSDASGKILDEKSTGYLDSGLVAARIPDGKNWCISATETPDSSNNGQKCIAGYAPTPSFNLKAGFYNSNQSLALSSPNNKCIIRFTTNCKEPDSSSKLFTGSIILQKSTVVKARCFDTSGSMLPSKVVTNSYFIKESVDLPVISISADSSDIWDYYKGIYVYGPNADSVNFPYFGSNFWQNWEKPCHVEYFKPSKKGNQLFELDAGLSIHGNWSKGFPQRSFRIETRNMYDSSKINYPLWDVRGYSEIENFNIRNAGIDWMNCHLRDDVMQQNVLNTHNDIMASQPCVVFLNGLYWGVYQIREKQDQDYLKAIHGIDPANVDILKWNNSVERGDGTDWTNLYSFISSSDMTQANSYDSLTKLVDIENYADYFASETYYVNNDWLGDWTNNIKFWKEKKQGRKWRYIMWDTDFGLGLSSSPDYDKLYALRYPNSWNWHSVMFDTIITNSNFRKYFVNRYADLINTVFLPSHLKTTLKEFVDTMDDEMLRSYKRWTAQTDLTNWQNNLTNMRNFIDARPAYARNFIQSNFNLGGQVTLTLDVQPAGAGKIHISTITPTKYPWNGVYFNGVPVMITAIANPGYTFSHYAIGAATDSSQSVLKNYTSSTTIKAYFTGGKMALKLAVSEINYNSPDTIDPGNWVELHNYGNYPLDISEYTLHTQGDFRKFSIPLGTVIPTNSYLVLCEDSVKFKQSNPLVKNLLGNLGFSLGNNSDSITLKDWTGKTLQKFAYSDTMPWPQLTDGWGRTLEHLNDSAYPNLPESWFNGCIGGSPGQRFSPCNEAVVVSEINYKSDSKNDAGDWVELHNSTSSAINLGGWKFYDNDDNAVYTIPKNTTIAASGYLVLASSISKFQKIYPNVGNAVGSFSFGLNASGEVLRLFDSMGNLQFNMRYDRKQPQWPYKPDGLGYTLEIKDSTLDYSSGESWTSGCYLGSPGNARNFCKEDLTISEINPNMETSLDKGDYLELYNFGTHDLQLGGWLLKTRTQNWIFPKGTEIKNGRRLLLCGIDSNLSSWNHLALQGFYLDNTSDSILLTDENGNVVLAANYDQVSGYPEMVFGKGFTFELKTDTANLLNPFSWFAGCLGGSPGVAYKPCASNILVSEINYSSAPEIDAGDWLELYNSTANAISLSSWSLTTKQINSKLSTINIQSSSRLVLAADSIKFSKQFPAVRNVVFYSSINLDSYTDYIKLYDSAGTLKLSLGYHSTTPWDVYAASNGYTLELKNGLINPTNFSEPVSWQHGCLGGSPGDSTGSCVAEISVSELSLKPDTLLNSGKWIELHNFGNKPQNLLGFSVFVSGNSYVFKQNNWLHPNGYLPLAMDSSLFNKAYKIRSTGQINLDSIATNASILLADEKGRNIYKSGYVLSNSLLGYGPTLESRNDTGATTSNWFLGCPGGSPGAAFSLCSFNPLIAEINTNPDPKLDDGQWLEIWNKDSITTLDLSGWAVGGDAAALAFTLPSKIILKPNARLVLCSDTLKFKAVHPFSKNYIGNISFKLDSTGVLRLWSQQVQPELVLFYHNIYQQPGYSLELLKVDNQLEGFSNTAAWQKGCYTGSPTLPYESCNTSIWVSEINYHSSLANDAGDWLELWNKTALPFLMNGWNILNESGKRIALGNLTVPEDSFWVIASDSVKFAKQHPAVSNETFESFSLTNTDRLRLYSGDGRLHWMQKWSNISPWNDSADGLGYTLELNLKASDPTQPQSWFIGCFGGSPNKRFQSCVKSGISQGQINNNELRIYPNPAKNEITIDCLDLFRQTLTIVDMLGRTTYETSFQGKTILPVADWSRGIYIINIGSSRVKLVID